MLRNEKLNFYCIIKIHSNIKNKTIKMSTIKNYTVLCLCHSCEIKTVKNPIFRTMCHCTFCTRVSGGVAVSFVGFENDGIEFVKGENNLVSHVSGPIERFFCKTCFSNVYNQSNIPGNSFKDCALANFARDNEGQILYQDDLKPESHMFYKRCQNCYKDTFDGDGLKKYQNFLGQ